MTTDIKLFDLAGNTATEIPGKAATVEKSLQRVIERNMESMLGIRLVRTEHSTGPKHRGRIDPDEVDLLPGFTRDVRGVGHYGTGDLEVRIRTLEGLERAKPLFQQSYEAS